MSEARRATPRSDETARTRDNKRRITRSAIAVAAAAVSVVGVLAAAALVSYGVQQSPETAAVAAGAAQDEPVRSIDPDEVGEVRQNLSALVSGEQLAERPSPVTELDANGDTIPPAGDAPIHSAYSDASDTQQHDYRVFVADASGDTRAPSCEEVQGAISCQTEVTAEGTLVETVYVHTKLPGTEGNALYTLLDGPLGSADLSQLRVQRAVEFYPTTGVKVAATETYYAPSTTDVASEFRLSPAEMRTAVLDPEINAILTK